MSTNNETTATPSACESSSSSSSSTAASPSPSAPPSSTSTTATASTPATAAPTTASAARGNPRVLEAMHQPVWDTLSMATNVLIAGCGGGYDFFAGIPIYFALKKAGVNVWLSNLTFTSWHARKELLSPGGRPDWLTEICMKVVAGSSRNQTLWTPESEDYWPELWVANWMKAQGIEDSFVYMIERSGVVQVKAAFEQIVLRHSIDTIITVDGGTDSLMTGNEEGLGTPTEDMTSICAISMLENVPRKLLMLIGLGVDCFHGVNHSLFLENVATLDQQGGFLGSFSLTRSMEEAQKLIDVFNACNPVNSIVMCSVTSAVEGHFGDYHANPRTHGSKLYISPLMSQYWAFDLASVARNVLYLDQIKATRSSGETMATINRFAHSTKKRKGGRIPY
ncbi:cell surface glycoprotein [Pelomyxa schiedti]|nr:cell surface glycoprotein [Pelomyxa schiedti]